LYEGFVTIKRGEYPVTELPIDFNVCNITLDGPDNINNTSLNSGISNDRNIILSAVSEAGFDPYGFIRHIDISKPSDMNIPIDPNHLIFDTNDFEESLDAAIKGGFAKGTVSVWLAYFYWSQIYNLVLDTNCFYKTDPNLWGNLDDPNFKRGVKLLLEKYKDIGDRYDPNINFIFVLADEAGINPYRRIVNYRLSTIVREAGRLTLITYWPCCDESCSSVCAGKYAPCPEQGSYNISTSDGNIPRLSGLIDYKIWPLWGPHVYTGYTRQYDPCDPYYYGDANGFLGYYTTHHAQICNPVYNRFLHGLYAFASDAKAIWAYSMGLGVNDPYNDFDPGATHRLPFVYPDFIFAYPTWSGELLYTMGGIEGVREGIKDAKYIATLQNLIAEGLNNPAAQEAQNYLNGVKSKINPNYGAYWLETTELGYYKEILADVNGAGDANDFEVFTRVRKDIAEYIVRLSSLASQPTPANEAQDVDINTSISWKPGTGVLSYDVYLGTSFNDVNDANTTSPEFMGNYDANSFVPNTLEYCTTYYWRIDSKVTDVTATGNIWSFTTKVCMVSFEDFVVFADYWLYSGPGLPVDFDDDDDVDYEDLKWFSTNWLGCCPVDWPILPD
jgi:hypothetical protein